MLNFFKFTDNKQEVLQFNCEFHHTLRFHLPVKIQDDQRPNFAFIQ